MTNRITLRDRNIHRLLKRCREKEAQGYECVKKIHKDYRYFKHFIPTKYGHEFFDKESSVCFQCVYEKKRAAVNG